MGLLPGVGELVVREVIPGADFRLDRTPLGGHDLPGTLVYAPTAELAEARVKALALRGLEDRLEHGEVIPELRKVFSVSA